MSEEPTPATAILKMAEGVQMVWTRFNGLNLIPHFRLELPPNSA